MKNVAEYAKFIVAVIGAGLTAALQFAAPDTSEFKWLTIALAVVTAIAVYVVPNAPAEGRHEAGNGV
jgi:hypothetical protein